MRELCIGLGDMAKKIYFRSLSFKNTVVNPHYPKKGESYLKSERIDSNIEGVHLSCFHSLGNRSQTIVFRKKLISKELEPSDWYNPSHYFKK
jgi:hypothetical protein